MKKSMGRSRHPNLSDSDYIQKQDQEMKNKGKKVAEMASLLIRNLY